MIQYIGCLPFTTKFQNFWLKCNGKCFLGSLNWKIPEITGLSEKVVPFPGWNFLVPRYQALDNFSYHAGGVLCEEMEHILPVWNFPTELTGIFV